MASKVCTFAEKYILFAAIVMMVALVYAVAFPGHFFLDDVLIVQGNNLVYGLDLKAIFTSDYWGTGDNTGLYRPLTILSFALNQLVFGPQPWGYLLVNIVLHAGVGCLLYHYLRRIGLNLTTAWLAAALFAVHPFHGEAVIELVGRAELLTALFGLLTLLFAQRSGALAFGLTVGCYSAAILCKEHGIVLLAMIPAVDFFFTKDVRGVLRRRGALLAVLLLLTACWLLYRKYVVHAGLPGPVSFNPFFIPLETVDAPTRILSALKLQVIYLVKMFFPYHLQGMYPASVVVPFISWMSLWGVTILIALGLIVTAVWVGWLRHNLVALAAVLYVLSFAPTSNIFFAAGFTMADRVAYFPSVWFCVGLASAMTSIPILLRNRRAAVAACCTIVLLYAAAGFARALDFRTPETLWLSDLRINPSNELSLLMLADHYRGEGRLQEAQQHCETMGKVAPNFEEGLSACAGVLVELGRPEEAITMAKRAISLKQGGESSAKIPLAAAYLKLGRPNDALATLEVVDAHERLRPVYWELLGKAYEAKGDIVGAIRYYQNELRMSGAKARDGFRRIGMLYLQIGRFAEAEEALQRDVRLNPESASAWNALGVALAQQGKRAEAKIAFQKALELRPDSQEYRANLEQVGRR